MRVLLERYWAPGGHNGEISVGDLVEQLGLSQPTVSKHLKVLRDHGLVSVREDGQHRYYRLDSGPLDDVGQWLAPFVGAGFEGQSNAQDDGASTVFAAWSGADMGDSIGRGIADRSHRARTVIRDAGGRVTRLLPKRFSR